MQLPEIKMSDSNDPNALVKHGVKSVSMSYNHFKFRSHRETASTNTLVPYLSITFTTCNIKTY